MLPSLARERAFDSACLLIGRFSQITGARPRAPYVVIGTGRTGTNLLERILRTHPSIAMFPGEANELWHPSLEPFDESTVDVPPIEIDPRGFSEASSAHWPRHHVFAIRDTFAGFNWLNGSSKTLVTKSAMLSFMIPQVLSVWPEARFIHLYRFGLPVVESYFKKNYGKYQRFSCSPDEYRTHCAMYWNACILEIERMNQELSLATNGRLLEVRYESLCQSPAATLRSLACYLQIDAEGFSTDFSQITDQNYKSASVQSTPEGQNLMRIMEEGLRLKGYMEGSA